MNRQRGNSYWLWRVSLSAVVLFCERLWRALWPAFAVVGLFVTIALFDVFAALPGWLHTILLVAFAAALAAALWWELRRLRLPAHTAARRRLEQVNDLSHRPLEALDDDVAGGADADPVTRALWRRHQERMRETIASLRVGAPHPRLARRDRHALRFGVVIGLGVAAIVAGDEAGSRLLRALTPDVSGGPAREAKLDAWLTPPEYTGRPPVFLSGGDDRKTPDGPIDAPQGSILTAQVSDARSEPVVLLPDGGTDAEAFEATAENSYRARVTLEQDGRVAVILDGQELGAWDVAIIPDEVPTAAFLNEPGQTALGALRIDFEAHDDYGLAGLTATIRRAEGAAVDAAAITFDLPLPGLNAKDATGTGYQDLTPHPWAGRPVLVHLTARDGRG